MRASRFLKSQRIKRNQRAFPISPFSIFLLGFGLVFWIIQVFTLLPNYECRYGVVWTSGWFEFASLFQIMAFLVGLIAVTFVVLLIFHLNKENLGEAWFQGAMVLTLVGVLVMHKAFLFPQAPLSWEQVVRTVSVVPSWKTEPRLVEQDDKVHRWSEGFSHPDVEFFEDPRFLREYNRRLSTIFVSKYSPLWSEYKALQRCDDEMTRALAQWKKDQEVLEQYWENVRYQKSVSNSRANES
ncbi:MAG: hypothetical protein ACX939_08905 [Hyphococcus sp.]